MAPKGTPKMAPKGTPKMTPQVQRSLPRIRPSPAKSSTMSVKKTTETLRLKENNTKTSRSTIITTTVKETKITETRQRTPTEPLKIATPIPATPKPKENKPQVAPGSVTKSGKKAAAWRRRPKPAHSGVPVPEKMKKLLQKYLQDDKALM